MTSREILILSIQAKTDSCVETYMRRRDFTSATPGKDSRGRSCPEILKKFDREAVKAKKSATYMICTFLAWHRKDLTLDYICELVVEAGHDPVLVGLLRPRMIYCREHGPGRECPA
jgi:hypothetical protein